MEGGKSLGTPAFEVVRERDMSPLRIFFEGTFDVLMPADARIISKISTGNTLALVDGIISDMHNWSEDQPRVVISCGYRDVIPQNLPTLNAKFLRQNRELWVKNISYLVLLPITKLLKKLKDRKGSLWLSSFLPRPANFKINSQVSWILSEAYERCNHYAKFQNQSQGLINLTIHRNLTYNKPQPGVESGQFQININRFESDKVHLNKFARGKVGRHFVNTITKSCLPRISKVKSQVCVTTKYTPWHNRR